MDKQYLETEFNTFFEFDSDDRSVVTSTSAKMFAEHMAAPIEAQVEQLRAEMSVLRDAVRPFVRLMKDTSGRIPTERLAFSDWHALAKVGGDDTATEMPNAIAQGREHSERPAGAEG
jgi:polyhydroxyalkanoate synthesis regulator protein